MKIGQLVRRFIPEIIKYCDNVDCDEMERLHDTDYSKRTFGIRKPFLLYAEDIIDNNIYWKEEYQFREKTIRVCNDWYVKHREKFIDYLKHKNIVTEETLDEMIIEVEIINDSHMDEKVRSKGRYKGKAIGNAQNLLVRNILSNLGDEVFSESDWKETKSFFNNECAYCGEEKKLVIEHAIPINKTMLGEHKLGNLVPSCHECNSKKGSLSYEQFLEDTPDKVKKIEEYMQLKKYEPLGNNEKWEIIAELLEKAYLDTAEVSKRYIQIIELIQAQLVNSKSVSQ